MDSRVLLKRNDSVDEIVNIVDGCCVNTNNSKNDAKNDLTEEHCEKKDHVLR